MGVGGATPSGSGSGITFPATQSASSDINTLDDYEEGTFTPTITFSGASVGMVYTNQRGYYTKIGREVFYQLYVTTSNKGSSTGGLLVEGLPFTSQSGASSYATPSFYGSGITFTNVVIPYQEVSSTRVAFLQLNASTGANSGMTNSNATNSMELMLTGSYQTPT
jgi:hypothetical protein